MSTPNVYIIVLEDVVNSMEVEQAKSYLHSLLNRVLHIYTTDNRMFVGEFKCTDNDRNIILAFAHEYRIPAPPSTSSIISPTPASAAENPTADPSGSATTVTLDLSPPRHVGLIVVPGPHITKIEVEGALPWTAPGQAGQAAARLRRKEAALVPGREAVGREEEAVGDHER
ncbi:hypothetical protein MMC18_009473 [Xylographa bjoerkii]|nr:hypothetical protein [Xylographa bjoerkii]